MWSSCSTRPEAATCPGILQSSAPGSKQAYEHRTVPVVTLGIAVYCLYAAVRTLISGDPYWPMWVVAAIAQLLSVAVWPLAASRLGAVLPALTAESRLKYWRVSLLGAVAAVSLFAAEPVARTAARTGSSALMVTSVALMVVALGGLVAAGRATIWVGKDEPPRDKQEDQ